MALLCAGTQQFDLVLAEVGFWKHTFCFVAACLPPVTCQCCGASAARIRSPRVALLTIERSEGNPKLAPAASASLESSACSLQTACVTVSAVLLI